MSTLREQRGFTLVEVIIVFAISALLIAGVFANRANVRDQATKTASIDSVKNQLEKIRVEANASVGEGSGRSSRTAFGKLVEFDRTTPDRMRISTLVAIDDDESGKLSRCETRDELIRNNLRYDPPPATPGGRQAIIFVRKSDTLQDQIYTAPAPYLFINPAELTPGGCTSLPPATNPPVNYGCSPSGTAPSTCPAPVAVTPPTPPLIPRNILDPRHYIPTSAAFFLPIVLEFETPDVVGRGFITVTPASNGITRRVE